MFSGLIWSGEQALDLGLIDGFASTSEVARDIVGAEELVDFTHHESAFERFARQIGASMGSTLATHIGLNAPLLR